MQSGKFRAQAKGFTLVEVLVGLGIMSVGMVFLNQFLFNTMRATKSVDNKLSAQNVGVRLKLNMADLSSCARVLNLAQSPIAIDQATADAAARADQAANLPGKTYRFLSQGQFSISDSLKLAGGDLSLGGVAGPGVRLDSASLGLDSGIPAAGAAAEPATLSLVLTDLSVGTKPRVNGVNSFTQSVKIALIKDPVRNVYTGCTASPDNVTSKTACLPGQILAGTPAPGSPATNPSPGPAECQPAIPCLPGEQIVLTGPTLAVAATGDDPPVDPIDYNHYVCQVPQDPAHPPAGTVLMCKGACQ